jgi:hypothetical protein
MSKTIKTKVVGVSRPNDDGHSRQSIIRDFVEPDDYLNLEREEDNVYNENAIAVHVSPIESIDYDDKIGYIRDELANELAPLMDSGHRILCQVLDVTGGEEGKSLGVNIELTIYTPEEFRIFHEKMERERERKEEIPQTPQSPIAEPTRQKPKIFSLRNILIAFGLLFSVCCILSILISQFSQ